MGYHEIREYIQLREEFNQHARRVVTQLQLVLDAVTAQDTALASQVINTDDNFDDAEVRLEGEILRILALYQPTARDLRLMMACLRINSFFERLADHAVNLARLTLKLHLLNDHPLPDELLAMCTRVGATAERTLKVFLEGDTASAESIAAEDVHLDRLDKALERSAEEVAAEQGKDKIALAFVLFRFGRELERIGDILAGWAEATIFLVTGEDVRHQKARLTSAPR